MPLLTHAQRRGLCRAGPNEDRDAKSKKMPPWFADSEPAALRQRHAAAGGGHQHAGGLGPTRARRRGDPNDALRGANVRGRLEHTARPTSVSPDAQCAVAAVPAPGDHLKYLNTILPDALHRGHLGAGASKSSPGQPFSRMHHAVKAAAAHAGLPSGCAGYLVGVPSVPAPRPGKKQRSSDGDRTPEGSLARRVAGRLRARRAAAYAAAEHGIPRQSQLRFLVLQLHCTANGTAGA